MDPLFDEGFLRRLEALRILSRKIFAGQFAGEHRAKKTGSGVEFSDHRPYAVGDDLRHLDWNLYGRLGKLQVRLFEEEEDLHVYLLLDTSASMAAGTPSKLRYASWVSAALAYVALANLDRAGLVAFSDGLRGELHPRRGHGQIHPILHFLEGLEPKGETAFGAVARTFVHRYSRKGLVVVLSDGYDSHGLQEGLDLLRHQRYSPYLIQILDEEEGRPTLRGEFDLVDRETGATVQVAITDAVLRRYRSARQGLSGELASFCKQRHIPYFSGTIQTPFDEMVTAIFRNGGFLT